MPTKKQRKRRREQIGGKKSFDFPTPLYRAISDLATKERRNFSEMSLWLAEESLRELRIAVPPPVQPEIPKERRPGKIAVSIEMEPDLHMAIKILSHMVEFQDRDFGQVFRILISKALAARGVNVNPAEAEAPTELPLGIV